MLTDTRSEIWRSSAVTYQYCPDIQ